MTDKLHQIMREVVKLGNLAEINEAAFRVVLRSYLNVKLSAAHLGVTQQTVRNKMREYGITMEELRREKQLLARQPKLTFR